MKIFYYRKSLGESSSNSFLSLLNGIYSPKILFPLRRERNDSEKVAEYKKRSNVFLYAFYIIFICTIIYSILYAMCHNGKVY